MFKVKVESRKQTVLQSCCSSLRTRGHDDFPRFGLAGSARDYLNAPIDSWLTFYNVGYSTSVTPEDGMDVTSSIRANVLSQSRRYPDDGLLGTNWRGLGDSSLSLLGGKFRCL